MKTYIHQVQARPSSPSRLPLPSHASSDRRSARSSEVIQAKLTVGRPGDVYEQEADRVADEVMRSDLPEFSAGSHPTSSVQRQCAESGAELRLFPQGETAAAGTIESASLKDGGRPLPEQSRHFFEHCFDTDFSGVRIRDDDRAARLARSVGARAFTHRNMILFNSGEYRPESGAGSHLLAHELTHVVQQGASGRLAERQGGAGQEPAEEDRLRRTGGGVMNQSLVGAPEIQRDLAIEPPNPGAPEPVLSDDDITTAIRYNEQRFRDPYTVMIVRDVVGIEKYPAVSDRNLALAIARWQASFNLAVDGKIGPDTTRTFVRELRAEDQRAMANLVREDNMVSWSTVNGPAYRACGEFQWDVNFNTTLREGWLIQRIENTWNATNCVGANVTPVFTRRYWEAWWVDANGRARIPTSTANPPTTVAPATADDLWRNPPIANSTGDWSQAGTMYTTLTLPRGFAIRAVPEAIDLPSTVGPVRGDDLGEAEAYRRVAGRWDCCNADPAQRFHRRT